MTKKLIIWIAGILMSIPIAFAQTGLFDAGTAGTFAIAGITIIVIIIVFKELFKRFFRK